MVFLIGYVLGLAVLSAFLTRAVLSWLEGRAILDAPTERSNHEVPTPKGGGIAIAISVFVGWLLIFFTRPDLTTGLLPPIILAAMALCLVSWLDDVKELGAAVRLPVHIATCAVGVWYLPGDGLVFQGLLPPILDAVLVVLVWGGFLNFYNFMDGIDGMAGVETVGIALGLVLVASLEPAVALPVAPPLALAAAAVGFLVWNWPPAKLFLGDVGSVPLGYCLGWFLLFLAVKGYWAAAIILPAYYLADAGITLLRRAARLERVWQAHREHFYQRAVAVRIASGAVRAGAHRQVSIAVGIANAGLIGLAVWSLSEPVSALAAAACVVGGLLWWMTGSRPARG